MNRNTRTILWLMVPLVFMIALVATSPTLYSMFCRVTGYDGTTQKADTLPAFQRDEEVKVIFSADVAQGMPWQFRSSTPSITVKLGAAGHATYHVKNTGTKTITGMASYNVLPEKAGLYFQKIKCFCFEKHTLKPGEEAEFPVLFFIDPSIADNAETKDVKTITLHYTYFEAKD